MEISHPYHYLKAHLFHSSESAVQIASTSMKNKDIKFAKKLLSAKNEAVKLTIEKKAKKYSDLTVSLKKSIVDNKLLLKLTPELFQELARQSVKKTITSPVQTSMSENNPFNGSLDETTNEPIYASIEEVQTATDSLNDSRPDFSNYPNTEAKKMVSGSTIHYLKAHLFHSSESEVQIASTSMKNKDIKFAQKLLSAKSEAIELTDEKKQINTVT